MKYNLTFKRKDSCDCYSCNKLITRSEPAYTSSKRKFCFSCGKLENDYCNLGMYRPHIDLRVA